LLVVVVFTFCKKVIQIEGGRFTASPSDHGTTTTTSYYHELDEED
jgi:hypothetical protein